MNDLSEASQLNTENHTEANHPEVTQPKKQVNKSKIVSIILGVFLGIAIIVAAGLGIWAYQLNTNLTATQKKLTSLQSDYDTLKTNNGQLTTNLSQVNSELDQTKTTLTNTQSQLTSAQSDLTKANGDNSALQSKIARVKPLIDIALAIFVNGENDTGIEAKVKATNETQLISSWNTYKKSHSRTDVAAFINNLFNTMNDALK